MFEKTVAPHSPEGSDLEIDAGIFEFFVRRGFNSDIFPAIRDADQSIHCRLPIDL